MPHAKCTTARRLAARLGDLIASARVDRGLTQRELAALAGVSKGMLSNIETGERTPMLLTLLLIAQALDVPLSGLLSSFDDFALDHDRVHR